MMGNFSKIVIEICNLSEICNLFEICNLCKILIFFFNKFIKFILKYGKCMFLLFSCLKCVPASRNAAGFLKICS